MGCQQITEFLSGLPDERTRRYEIELTHFVAGNGAGCEDELLTLTDTAPEPVCYNAFYCLNIHYRHVADYNRLLELVKKYERKFRLHVTFRHLKVASLVESDSFYDYDTVLTDTYYDAQLFTDNAGFIHQFPYLFACFAERGGMRNGQEFIDEWADKAYDAVEKAIALDASYAKYYCTKARILNIKKQYALAMQCINRAISLENSKRADYVLRISEYQYYKMLIVQDSKLDALAAKLMAQLASGLPLDENKDAPVPELSYNPYEGNEPFVFISYAHRDSEALGKVLGILTRAKVRFWYDKGIPQQADYDEYIAGKILACSAVVLIVTASSMDSQYVNKELALAWDNKVAVVQVRFDKTPLSPGKALQMGHTQTPSINAFELSGAQLAEKLLAACPKACKDAEESN